MALSFPLTKAQFADRLFIGSVKWNLVRFDEISGNGGGEWLTTQLQPPLWEAACETIDLPNDAAHGVRALLNLIGSTGTVFAWNPLQGGPAADPDGVTLGASAPVIASIAANRKDMSVSGLPSGYVLSAGDLMEVDYGSPSRRALVEVSIGATAAGNGTTPVFEVRPHLRPGIVTGAAVGLLKPAAKMKLVPGSDATEVSQPMFSRVRFTLRQTLAAG